MIGNSVARVLIAPDSFKGSAMSTEIAEWIKQGWLEVRPQDQVVVKPMADGGEGTLLAIEASLEDTTRITQSVMGPDNRSHNAFWLLTDDGVAIVELASICGITQLDGALLPIASHTFGLGQVLYDISRDTDIGAVIVALGGSASTDGGTGALRALGYRFLKEDGGDIAIGSSELKEIIEIDSTHAATPPPGALIYLVDVANPLLGERGAARIFAPQKGANETQVVELEAGLSNFLRVCEVPDSPGAGAAGGTAYGLSSLWGGQVRSGARTIATITKLHEEIAVANFVITGEGHLDSQSFGGKVVGTIAELVKAEKVRKFENENCAGTTQLAIIAGGVDGELAREIAGGSEPHLSGLLAGVVTLTSERRDRETAMVQVCEATREAAADLARKFTLDSRVDAQNSKDEVGTISE